MNQLKITALKLIKGKFVLLTAFYLVACNVRVKNNALITKNLVALQQDSWFIISRNLENFTDTAKSHYLNRIGNIYYEQAKYDSALFYFQNSLVLRNRIGDKELIANSIASLADIDFINNKFDSCISKYQYIFSIRKDTNNLIADKINFGIVLHMANKDNLSKIELQNAIFLSRQIKDSTQYFKALYNYAIIELTTNSQLAIAKFNEVHNYYKRLNQISKLAYSYNSIAALMPNNVNYYDSSLKYALIMNLIDLQKSIYYNKSVYFNEKQKYETAYNLLKKSYSLNDSIYSQSLAKNITDIEVRYRTSEKEASNKLLTSENKRKTNILYSVLAAVFLLLIIAFFYYKNYKNKQQLSQNELQLKNNKIDELLKNQELEVLDALLEGQGKERERIAQDLHDKLGSAIGLAKVNFEIMQDEIKNIELKNQKNYDTLSVILHSLGDDLRSIAHELKDKSLGDYGLDLALQNLCNKVQDSTGIKVQYNAANLPATLPSGLQLDVYRILQELTNNTMKYATASTIFISVFFEDNTLHVNYEDNGVGFSISENTFNMGIGYKNIAARLQRNNGTYTVESSPGQGMAFFAEIKTTIANFT